MIKLTRPDGSPVWIFKAWVQCVVMADKHLYPAANTQVVLSGPNIGVLETIETVISKLES